MADEVSVEDLEKQRQTNDELREQIAAAEAERADREATLNREIEYAQLQAEEARLRATLASAQETAREGAVTDAAAGPLAQAREQAERARALEEGQPAGVPVDTNAQAESKNKGTARGGRKATTNKNDGK